MVVLETLWNRGWLSVYKVLTLCILHKKLNYRLDSHLVYILRLETPKGCNNYEVFEMVWFSEPSKLTMRVAFPLMVHNNIIIIHSRVHGREGSSLGAL